MPYRMKPDVPLLVVKDETGRLRHHDNQPIGGSIGHGSVIPYLNDAQRDHFLRLGLVEEIGEELEARTAECVEALDRLGVPVDAGAPTVRAALRDSDCRFGNDTIAAAVKARKDSHRELSGTAEG
jgi:cytochrome c oxidase cbb3-type subunit 2